jgi:hypothetical protein
MKLYVVHMLRYGDTEAHSYIEGVYDSEEQAIKHGKAEEEHRAGKYEPAIRVFPLNEPIEDKYLTDEQLDKKYAAAVDKSRAENPELWKEWDEMGKNEKDN